MDTTIVKSDQSTRKTFDYWTEAVAASVTATWGTDLEKIVGQSGAARIRLARMLVSYYDDSPESLEVRHAVQRAYVSGIMDPEELDRVNRTFPLESRLPKVLSNICRTYQRPPRRTFSAADGAQGRLTSIYRTSGFDRLMVEIHQLTRLGGTTAIRPVFRRAGDRMRWQKLTPDRFHAWPDAEDPSEVGRLCYPFRAVVEQDGVEREVIRIRFWTAAETWITDDRGRELEGSRRPNRYGRIPYTLVRLRDPIDGGIFGPGWFDGVAFQVSDNVLRLSGDRNVLYNSFVVILAVNLGLKSSEVSLGAGRIMTLDGLRDESQLSGGKIPPNLSTLDLQSNFLAVEEFRAARKKEFLRDNFLPSYYWDESGSPPSGVALRIQREELRKEGEKDEVAFVEAERDAEDLVRRTWNVDYFDAEGNPIQRPPADALPEAGDEFAIDYAEEEQYLETTVEYELDGKLLETGVMPLREYYAKWSGDDGVDTDDQAAKRMRRNRDALAAARADGVTPPATVKDGAAPDGPDGETAIQTTTEGAE